MEKKDIKILTATAEEYEKAREEFKEYEVIHMGVGAGNVIATLSMLPMNTVAFNVGYAGSNRCPIGTVAPVRDVYRLRSHSAEFDDETDGIRLCRDGFDCYTSNDFVTYDDIPGGIVFDGDVLFDMELSYITAFRNITLMGAIKIVSDSLSLSEYVTVVECDDKECWKEAHNLVNKMVMGLWP